jgi:hypothetical protein
MQRGGGGEHGCQIVENIIMNILAARGCVGELFCTVITQKSSNKVQTRSSGNPIYARAANSACVQKKPIFGSGNEPITLIERRQTNPVQFQ